MSNIPENNDTVPKKKDFYGCRKLETYDWLADIPPAPGSSDNLVEDQIKKTSKRKYPNSLGLDLVKCDLVGAGSNPGHVIVEVMHKGTGS